MTDEMLSVRSVRERLRTIERAALGLSAYSTLVRDPNKLEKVFALRDHVADEATLRAMLEHFRKDARGRDALAARPRIGRVNLDTLATLPADTLGGAFARNMRAYNLDPGALPVRESRDELSFLDAHLYETHDVWHTVTGFGVDVAGELGLQAFYAAQFPAKLSYAIMSAGLLNTMLVAMHDADRRMDAIAEGWAIGRRAKPFFGVRWADWWSRPLREVREELDVVPAGTSRAQVAVG
ncbi:MAG: hypothetical protein JNK05_05270 [Myxococcales bacterium]|nr:hypothetical protein [Myxococcales bacterium]